MKVLPQVSVYIKASSTHPVASNQGGRSALPGEELEGTSSHGPNREEGGSRADIYSKRVGAARSPTELSEQELQELFRLKKRDQEVKQHEMAHIAAGGTYVRGGAHFEYKTGPDGRRYAVAGEVSIDTSPEKDPKATLQKMRTVERAALAPAHPSAQDRRVAAQAAAKAIQAMVEIMKEAQENKLREEGAKGGKEGPGGREGLHIVV